MSGKPQHRHSAHTHFLRDCPQLPQKERDNLAAIFEEALQLKSLPREGWPKKLYGLTGVGQSVNARLIDMVEEFYEPDTADYDYTADIRPEPPTTPTYPERENMRN